MRAGPVRRPDHPARRPPRRHAEQVKCASHLICVMQRVAGADRQSGRSRCTIRSVRRAVARRAAARLSLGATGKGDAALDYTELLRCLAINDARFGGDDAAERASAGRSIRRRWRWSGWPRWSRSAAPSPSYGAQADAAVSAGATRRRDRRRAGRRHPGRRAPVRRRRGPEARDGARVRHRRGPANAVRLTEPATRRAGRSPSPAARRRRVTRRPACGRSSRPGS